MHGLIMQLITLIGTAGKMQQAHRHIGAKTPAGMGKGTNTQGMH